MAELAELELASMASAADMIAARRAKRMLVGHQPCGTCRGGHTTWTCLECGGVVYGPALQLDCRVLAGPAAVR